MPHAKEDKAFQNQAEGPLVFLLTFWAMSILMILYTFWHNELVTFFLGSRRPPLPGRSIFLPQIHYRKKLKRKKRRWLRWSKLTQ